MEFLFDGIGPVVTRTTLDGLDFRVRNQLENLPGLGPDILDTLMTRYMPHHLAQRGGEIGFQLSFLVAQHQVFKRVKECIPNFRDLGIIRKHQWQLLFEHQRTARDRCDQVVSFVHQFCQYRDIDVLRREYRVEIAQFQLWHTATFLFLGQHNRNAVMLEYLDQVFAHVGFIAIAVTGCE